MKIRPTSRSAIPACFTPPAFSRRCAPAAAASFACRSISSVSAPVAPYPAHFYAQGLTVMLNDEQKLNPYDHQAGHKTLDYFSRLAGLREAVRRGAGEALWFDVHNYLQSASVANVFLVKDGALITPPTQEELRNADVAERTPYPKSNVLPGITRAAVIELAHANNLPVHIQAVNVNDLLAAREVFLTNSIMQVMPVGRIEQHAVSEGGVGPVT